MLLIFLGPAKTYILTGTQWTIRQLKKGPVRGNDGPVRGTGGPATATGGPVTEIGPLLIALDLF